MTSPQPLQPDDLYRLRLINDVHISPDGQRVAFVLKQLSKEEDDTLSNIYVAGRDGTVTQFTSGNKDWGPRWSPDGRWLAFVSGRKERSQLHLMPAHGGESVALTDRKRGAGVPVWAPDSSALAFVGMVGTDGEDEEQKPEGNEKKKAPIKVTQRSGYKLDGAGYIGDVRRHIFLIHFPERRLEQLTSGDFHHDSPAWSPDGQHIAFSSNRAERWDVTASSDICLIPRSGGEIRTVTSGGWYVEPAFSPDGSRIAFAGQTNPDDLFFAPLRLYSVDRSGSGFRDEQCEWDGSLGNDVLSDVVASAGTRSASPEWRDDGIYFLGTERGEANVYSARDGQVCPVTTGRHTVVDFSYAEDGTLAFACADATHLAEIYLQCDGQTVQLTHENEGVLSEVRIAKPQRISFVGAEGVESEGWLLAPPDAESGKHPLLVYIHGGPMLAHGEALFFEYQMLAGRGFGVFYPNLHGSASYGRAYQTSITGDWGNLDYQDVLSGFDAAIQQPWVDPARAGLVGGSYGGYMTSWALGHGDQFRAGVVERPVVNMVSFVGTADNGWMWNRVFGAYPEEDVLRLWDMSPIKYVANVKAPTMVIHYERDDRTPIEQGEQYFNALRRLGVETQFVIIPEESHGLTRGGTPSRRVTRMQHILDWFQRYL